MERPTEAEQRRTLEESASGSAPGSRRTAGIVSRERATARAQRSPALAIAALGVLATLGACFFAARREANRNQELFNRRAGVLAAAVARSFQMTREVVLSIPALFESSINVEQGEFRTFVRPALRRHPNLAALEWAPLVKDADRAAFEAKIAGQGFAGFQIREPGRDGKMVRSAPRAQYLPLTYLEPAVEAVRGLEVLFEPVRRVEIQTAIDQGSLHVSHRFRLVEDPEGVQSVAVYAPGYDQSRRLTTPAERREALLGLGIALFRLRPLMEAALAQQQREGVALALIDPTAPPDLRVLYETEKGTWASSQTAAIVHEESFDFGNRRYRVVSVARATPVSWAPWFVLAIGLGLTLTASAGFLTLSTIKRLRRTVAETVSLGQYTLEEKIGEGGMGVVYRAKHAMLRRPAAIKLLLKKDESDSDLRRFEREVQLTCRLAHPNTISIFDYGRTADGVFYYVMEFLDGMDLERLVRADGPLDAGRAIHILAQVAGALAEAHLSGLIHRDIKPANIVLTERRDEPDVVKVVDFGLVKTLDPGQSQIGITRVNAITGTPLYLAPEAISSPTSVDGRGDIYALGAVAYFILTGEHVFQGSTVLQILTKHLFEEPMPPSERSGRPIADDLERLILTCLAKDRSLRPPDAAALRDALLACRDAKNYDIEATRKWWRERGAELRTSARLERQSSASATTMAIDFHDRPRASAPGSGA